MPTESLRESEAFAQGINDELKTVRTIHFTLLLTAATIAYVVFANWTPVVELREQLEDFQAVAHGLTRPALEKDASTLTRVSTPLMRFVPSLKQSLASMFGERVWLDRNFIIKIDELFRMHGYDSDYMDSVGSQSLEALRGRIDTAVWYIDVPSEFLGDVKEARQDLIDERGNDTGRVFMAVDIHLQDMPQREEAGTASIHLLMTSPSYHSDFPPLGGTTVEVSWLPRMDSVQADSNWFAREFPEVLPYWDSVKAMKPAGAVTWARRMELHAMDGATLGVFGVAVQSRAIRIAGPIAVILIFFYLTAHVMHLRGEVRRRGILLMQRVPGISPWIGTMGGDWHRNLTFLTLTSSLYMGVALPGWRLWGLSTFQHVLVGIVCATCAWLLADRAYDLGRMYKRMSLVQTWEERRAERKRLKKEEEIDAEIKSQDEEWESRKRKAARRERVRLVVSQGTRVLRRFTKR